MKFATSDLLCWESFRCLSRLENKMIKSFPLPRSRVVLASMLLTLAESSIAAPVLEEVVVTAQKVEQSLQDTPISIAVLDNDAIQRLGVTNVGDIGSLVPNLAIRPHGASPTTLRFFIRGIGGADSQITQDSPVAMYLDGVYIARNMGLAADVADIERIEVLRGPQGALYGRNTTGGAVNIITKRPSGTSEFSQLLTFGRFDQVRSKTTLDLPVTKNLSAKAGYEHSQRDGWIENSGAGSDFHEYDRDATRLDVRWNPMESTTVDYAFDYSKSKYTTVYWHMNEPNAQFAGVLTPQPNRVSIAKLLTPVKDSEDRSSGHTLTVNIDTALGELKSITAYRELEQKAYADYSGNPDIALFLNNPLNVDQDQWSQELNLIGSSANERLDYIAGIYYFTESARELATDQIPIFGVNSDRNIAAKNESWAGYGKLTWRTDASSPWSYSFGARFTRDKREGTSRGAVLQQGSLTSNNVSPSLIINYDLRDNISFYTSVTSGYKSGGFNMRQTEFAEAFDEENLVSWELGWKSELLERRLRFNGALFYMDYSDIQLDILVPDQPNPALTITQNAGKAEIYGLESDIVFALTGTARASVSYAYLGNDVREVKNDDADLWQVPYAIKHSINATLDADVLQTSLGLVNFSIDYAWRDESDAPALKRPGFNIDPYGLLNSRLSLTGNDWFGKGGYRLSVWGKNLLDEEYYLDSLGSFAGLYANRITSYGEPRTYGIDLEYRF